MAISPARLAAFDILLKIEQGHGFSSELLAQFEETLNEKDRSLCHELTLGTLRRQIYLDRLIEILSNGKKIDREVRIALRLGLYQLRFLDRIPDYSAINESVELVRRAKKTSAKGLVNAILRRSTRETVDIAYTDEIDRIVVETSHPRWLIEKWIEEFGIDETNALAIANNMIPNTAFRTTSRFRSNHSHDDELAVLAGLKRSDLVTGCYLADHITADIRSLEQNGEIYFQDEGSQLVAQAVKLKAGEKFLDVCAAPGSKTTAIASRHDASGIRTTMIAGDVSETRVRFLKANCAKQGVEHVNYVEYDAVAALPFADESFDVVLIDAPCSGTGTVMHNPEIRYRLRPDDWDRLAKKQLEILRNAAAVVVPGGRIVYSTCSLEKEENEDVVFSFLSSAGNFVLVPPDVSEDLLTSDGFARTYPFRDNMDGFFIAVLQKAVAGFGE